MKYILFIILTGFLLPVKSQDICTGKLDNGLTYYLIKNNSKKIDFRLMLNVGAAWEKSEESGFVHFIEHLSFYGSKNFPYGIGKFMKDNHITNNASTYKDKVIYSLEQVDPLRTSVDSCIYVLHDWGRFLHLDARDIEKEKRVVFEEKRSDQRLTTSREELVRLLYNHTKFALPTCLGDMDILGAVTPASLSRFYDKWFVPAFQAIYIEGDIDVEEYRAKIEACYSDYGASAAVVKDDVVIPDNDSLYLKLYRSTGPYGYVEITSRLKNYLYADKFDFLKKQIYTRLYTRALRTRLTTFGYRNGGILFDFDAAFKTLATGYSILTMSFVTVCQQTSSCLENVMACARQLAEEGFLPAEKDVLLTDLRTLLDLDATYQVYRVAEDHFLQGTPLYSAEELKMVARQLGEAFDNEDFKSFCKHHVSFKNTLAVASVDRSTTERDITRCFDDNTRLHFPVHPIRRIVWSDDLPRDTAATRTALCGGVQRLILNNGIEIFYIQTASDSIVLNGFAPGGTSVYEKADIPLSQSIAGLMNTSRVNEYDICAVDLYKATRGIVCHFETDEYYSRVKATSGIDKAPVLFSFLFHKMMDSGYSKDEMDFFKIRETYRLGRQRGDGSADEMQRLLYGLNPRQLFFTASYFDNFDEEDVCRELKKVYRNAANWCYVIEAGMPVEEFKNKYVPFFSNMTSDGGKQQYVVHKKFRLKKDFRKVLSARDAGVDMRVVLNKRLDMAEVQALHVLQYIVKNRCLAEFRDKRSALYGMYTEVSHVWHPENLHVLRVNFGTASPNVIPFLEFINRQLKMIGEEGVSELEWKSAKSDFYKREYSQIRQQGLLDGVKRLYAGESNDLSSFIEEDAWDSPTIADVVKIARLIVKKGKKIEYISK